MVLFLISQPNSREMAFKDILIIICKLCQIDQPYSEDAPPPYSSIFITSRPNRNNVQFPFLPFESQSSFEVYTPPPSYAQSQGIFIDAISMDSMIPASCKYLKFYLYSTMIIIYFTYSSCLNSARGLHHISLPYIEVPRQRVKTCSFAHYLSAKKGFCITTIGSNSAKRASMTGRNERHRLIMSV